MNKRVDIDCPCGSGKKYNECCYLFHKGQEYPSTPELLMRSRYSAYFLRLPQYIIDTTHPHNQSYEHDETLWKRKLTAHMKEVSYLGLKVTYSEMSNDGDTGYVQFTALALLNGNEASFTERSRFVKLNNKWLYIDGIIIRKK